MAKKTAQKKATNNVVRIHKTYGLELQPVFPKTKKQEDTFETFHQNHLRLHGLAGTGKTFLSVYLALREILDYGTFDKLIIVRSAVQGRDQGFMPGSEKDKMAYYEKPYRKIASKLFGRDDAYDILKTRGVIEFESTSFLRGDTFVRSIVLVDEMQNMTFQELDTIATRADNDTKMIFAGDYRQSDLKKAERSGLNDFLRILSKMDKVECVEFGIEDIVRSGWVKQYIIEKTELGL